MKSSSLGEEGTDNLEVITSLWEISDETPYTHTLSLTHSLTLSVGAKASKYLFVVSQVSLRNK